MTPNKPNKPNKRIEKVYTLSPMQAGMFFHALKNEKTQAYFEQIIFEIAENIQPELLEQSFNLLMARYDILRTIFRADKLDEPHQFVLMQRNFKLYFEDISHLNESETNIYLAEFAKKDKEKGFDLTKDILMRVSLFKKKVNTQFLVWSFHHILMDGWCLGIIYRELIQIYRSLIAGEPVKLAPVIPYINYIHWLERQDKEEGLRYWEKYLDGYDRQASLPKSEPGKAEEEYRLAEYEIQLDKKIITAIGALAGENRVTVNTVFQALWGVLLQKYTACDDVVFGVVVAGRPAEVKGIENMVGLFINTIPIRIKNRPGCSFVRLLKNVHEETIVSKRYEYLPLAEIQAKTELKGSLIDHIMAFENLPINNETNSTGLTVGNTVQHNQTGYDFNIIIIPQDSFIIKFSYNALIYESEFIERLARHLEVIINRVTADPKITCKDIEIITEAERHHVLFAFNDTQTNYPENKTIPELFTEQSTRTPDHIALSFSPVQLTYRRLNHQAGQLAGLLLKKGVMPDDIVGIMIERSAEMIIGILGILKAGSAYMPIDPEYPQERITYMLRDSGAKILINKSEIRNSKFETNPNDQIINDQNKNNHFGAVFVLNLEHLNFEFVCTRDFDIRVSDFSSSNLAYLMYTSGSTGKPKGVMVTHRNVVRLVKDTNFVPLNEETRILQTGAPVFDATTFEIWGSLLNGGQLVLTDKEVILDAGPLANVLKNQRINTLWLSVSLFNRLEQQDIALFASLSYLLVGGDALTPGPINRVKQRFPNLKIVNGYGPTENTTFSATYLIEKEFTQNIPVGRPIANSTVYIYDKSPHLAPIGVIGELYAGGAGVARGYMNNPELTAKKFIKFHHSSFVNHHLTLYRTGDRARWLADGTIEFKGRTDQQVKIRGFRIEIGEIETRLRTHEEIKDAIVVVKEETSGDKYLCAYVVTGSTKELGLREYLAHMLPDYMIPAYFLHLEKIPLTVNGKVDRKALPEPILKSGKSYIAPQNEIEEKLVVIWSEILGIEKDIIGIDDNFFQLGGHSLKATSVTAKIQKVLETNVPLAEIFKNPTTRTLSSYIEKTGTKEKFHALANAEKKEYYPLSSAQKRLYLLQQINPESIVYHVPALFALAGELELRKMQEAFQKLVQRHESLRTSFHMIAGEPAQKVHDHVEFELEYLATDAYGVHGQTRTFNLAKAPLLRVILVKEEDEKYKLMLDMHHIITDGTSTGILINEFMALYRGEELPALRIQYKDYSHWQNHLLQNEIIKQQETYWLNQLASETPVLNLPLDFPRPTTPSYEGSIYTFSVGKEQTQQLKTLALEEGVSLFMVLMAAFNIFLAKVSGQEHIIIGTPTAGRKHIDLERIIGMFVNTLPLSNYPCGEKTFREFLKEEKEHLLTAFENQDYQFEDLVDKLAVPRNTGRNPLFDVMFALQNMEMSTLEIPGLKVNLLAVKTTVSRFDMTVMGVESDEKILFSVEYCTQLFKPETVARLFSYYNRVLASVLENRSKRIATIDIMNEDEKRQVLIAFNDTASNYLADKTIHELFQEQVSRTPDFIALSVPLVQLTYRQLNEQSGYLAGLLQEKGVLVDDIVGIMIERSAEMIIGILGILKAGGAYMPIDAEYPLERIDYMLKDSGAKILITKSEIRNPKFETNPNDQNPNDQNKNQNFGAAFVLNLENLNFEFVSNFEFRASKGNFNSSNLAYIIYTSGSTGKPKGVLTMHCNVTRLVKDTNYIHLEPGDRLLQIANYAFDGSVFDIFGALLNGAGLVIVSKDDVLAIDRLSEIIKRVGITVFFVTTALFNILVEMEIGCFDRVRKVLLGGERASVEHSGKMLEYWGKGRMINAYGPTEATVYATYYFIDTIDETPGSIPIGKPVSGTEVYILDKDSNPVPIGVQGELSIGGSGLARGYMNNPELTAEKFYRSYKSDRSYILYKTGDLARWLPNGNIEFLGRKDFQVKIRGFRVEPGEIEQRLLRHENIKEAIVEVREEKNGEKYVCAYFTPVLPTNENQNLKLAPSKLREFLSGKLPPYMIPQYFVPLEKIPLNTNGKIDRKLLPEPVISTIRPDAVYIEPLDEMEQIIAGVWKDVLKVDQVGTHDNFFDLGGNSLKIIQANSKLTENLGIKIPVVNLFKYPTINSLKEYLTGRAPKTLPVKAGVIKETPFIDGFAVIGMAGRFPGAANISQYWENVINGVESITFFTPGELAGEGVPLELLADPAYVKSSAVQIDKDRFDAAFFNYAPQEARVMDPQMRVFHECVWEALEDAGYDPETYDKPIGLYAGARCNIAWEAKVKLFAGSDIMNSLETFQLVNSLFIPTRISYKLNLKGPALFIHTACSTSLISIHTACNALSAGDCVMALAGGVSLSDAKKSGYLYQEGLILSPDGHCRAFDNGAAGTVGGEGAAVVLLKPLPQASADNDHIYAVIKASATNNDGSRKVGFSAPSIDGQAEAIAAVYHKTGIPLESITYIETHGTGTALGDPIELAALKQAFNTSKKGFCALGSVKPNVGHMDSASGAAGFIKAVLALKYRKIPPTLHFETPNTQTDLIDSPFYINTTLKSWETNTYPLRAGVSSFGIGGTNAHVILEEYANVKNSNNDGRGKLVLLSAKTPAALEKMKENLRDFLTINKGMSLTDIAYTLQTGRKLCAYKWMALCATIDETIASLAAPGNEEIPDWKSFFEQETRNRVSLPTYPFEVEGQRYWIEGDPFNIEALQHLSQLSPELQTLKKQDIADWFYLPRWTQSALVPATKNKGEHFCYLIFTNDSPLVLKLVQRLQSENPGHLGNLGTGQKVIGQKVITVFAGEAFAQKGDHEFVIDPRNVGDYETLLTTLNRMEVFPHRIVHAWNVTGIDNHPTPGIVGPGFYSLLYLAKAIGKQDFDGDMRVDTLTANAQEVTGNEALCPGNALNLGPLKVIPQEYPYIICRSIDIEPPPPGDPREEILVRYLNDELSVAIDSPDTDIAYRNHYRWVKTYEPVRIEPPVEETLSLRDQGVYLITGGIGEVGVTLARYLIQKFRARVILTGTSPLPPREEWDEWLNSHDGEEKTSLKIMKIRRLEAAAGNGCQVLFFAADVGDKKAMAEVIRQAEETLGPIHGVIHAAGVTRDKSVLCSIEETGENEWNRQFRPKVVGTTVLAELFQDKPLDFCLLTSSLSPILGGLGFAAYAAANAFMDAFVYHVNRTGSTRWLSVNWADWGFKKEMDMELQVGMGASAAELVITPEEGVETFKRVLTLIPTPARQAAISSGDLQTRIDRWVKLRSLRKSDSPASPDASSLKFENRPHLSTEYAAPRSMVEQAIAEVWKNQFGIDKIGIHDDFFELGGDSLKAISMISRIHKELNARVQLNDFFSRPTVETLAQFITGAEKSGYTSIQPAEKKEYYSLSPAQKRLYLLDQMVNLGVGYNQTLTVELTGKLDKERFEKAFNKSVKRHETFRTSFIMVDDKPVQRIHDEVPFEIEFLAKEDFIRIFDLSKAPLMRVGLIKEENDKHLLLVDMHHIISDGVSHLILVKEFIDLYENKALPALHLQYKDYSEWHNSTPRQEAIKNQERYWLNELGSEVPVLDIPTDYARPAVQNFAGGAVEGDFTEIETKALNEIVHAEGATLFMGLLAAYTIFLAKISTCEVIPVGCPVAGRGHADLEQIIGMFVNTLVLRNSPLPGQTFRQYLREVKQKTLAAFENQDYPFEELVEKVVQERDTSRNPLFDAAFVLQNMIRSKEAIPQDNDLENKVGDLKIELLPKTVTASQFDLILEAVEIGTTISFSLEYCSQLFQAETIIRFVEYFKKVIVSIIENPGLKISEIEIISEEEKKQLLVDFNDTGLNYPNDKTIPELFQEQAKRTPDSIALVGTDPRVCPSLSVRLVGHVGHFRLSYKKLNEQSGKLAGLLIEKGVLAGDIVGIMIERSVAMIIGILGILKSGGAYLPIDPENPKERIDYILKDSNVRILINKSETRNDQNKSQYSNAAFVLNLDHLNFEFVSNFGFRISNFNSSNLAYLIYTSGSTGQPKGVPITHANLSPLLHWGYRHLGLGGEDRFLQNLSYYFDWSVWEIFIGLTTGASLYMVPKELLLNPEACVAFMVHNNITVLHVTPTQYQYYLKAPQKPGTLKYLFIGAEKLNRELVESAFASVNVDCRVFNMYGPTECTIISAVLEIRHSDLEKFGVLSGIPIGRAVGNSELFVLDRHLNLCPVKVSGELYIAGDCVAQGYLNRPELTAEKFINFHHTAFSTQHSIFYRTGDRVKWLPNGHIEFLARIDQQVKIRGYRIELGEIENRLLGYKGIKGAVVLVKEDGNGDNYLCAYIVSGHQVDNSELRSYLSGYLPGYMVPSFFTELEKIPLNPNGKVDIKALPEPGLKPGGEYTAPRNEIEKKLLAMWSEILGQTTIGIDDNFFHKGGHSLKAATLASKVQKAFNVHLPLAEIFRTPTIRELSQYIGNTCQEEYLSIEAVEKREYYKLSSAQKRLYVLQQMTVNNTAYNMPQTIFLGDGQEIDQEKLEATFRRLIARHESLRTSFHMIDDELVQVIHDEVEFAIEYLAADQHGQIQTFDLSKAPLLRVAFRKEKDNHQTLQVDIQHIISDGLSMQILNRDFMALYDNQSLPGLHIQYKEFAHWQNSLKVKEKVKKQAEYWLKLFAGEIPILNLPLDYPRPPMQSFEGGSSVFVIKEAETSCLKQLAFAQGVTLYMVLLAFINILMSRLSSQEDIIIGTPTAGRGHPDLENIIGMFVNTLALRNRPAGEKSFVEFLKDVKIDTLEAFENQGYQFEDLLEAVNVKRDTGRNPLFDVMFSMQTFDVQAADTHDSEPVAGEFESRVSKFDMTWQAFDLGAKIFFNIQYSSKLFKPESILRFRNYFQCIAASVLADPGKKLNQLDIIGEEEKQLILNTFNDTAVDFPRHNTLHQLFAEQVKRTPDRLALVGADLRVCPNFLSDRPIQLTYCQLNEQSNRLAGLLSEKGVTAEDIVGIMMERSLEMIIGILGILKSGGSYLPIDPEYPQDRIDYMLKDSNAKFIVGNRHACSEELNCQLSIINCELLTDAPKATFHHSSFIVHHSNHLAYLIYTSGSTGKPKGVIIEHASAVNLLYAMQKEYPLEAADTYLLKTSYVFDVSVTELFGWYMGGGRVAILEKGGHKDPQAIVNAIERNMVSHINFVPAMFNAFIEYISIEYISEENKRRLSSLKYIFLAGEALAPELVEKFKDLNTNITLENIYGPTESTVYASKYSLSGWNGTGSIPIGRPLANIKLYILNNDDHLQPVGVAGELCISGFGLARGYINRPELTAERFNRSYGSHKTDILYRTGDLAKWRPDGNIEFLGRNDNQVKIRGYRIELGEIISRLLDYNDIKEAVVVARHDIHGDQYLGAYMVTKDNKNIEPGELKHFLAGVLPGYMIPSYFVRLDHVPLTPNGKIDKESLPEPGGNTCGETYQAPSTPTEIQLSRIYSELFNIEKVGLRDNFFSLGGNSLHAIKLVSQIHKMLHIDIPIYQVFKTPGVKEFAMVLFENKFIESKEETIILLNSPKPGKIFAFPPAGGYGLSYIELARLMPGYAFYAFNYIDTQGEEDKMKIYLDALREIQPEGPYILLGYSAGAKMCVKTAELLEKEGETVPDIIILDGYSRQDEYLTEKTEEDIAQFHREIELSIESLGLRHLKDKIIENMEKYRHYQGSLEIGYKLGGTIHLIRAEGKNREGQGGFVGWQDYTRDREIVYEGYGSHHEMLAFGFIEKNTIIIESILSEKNIF